MAPVKSLRLFDVDEHRGYSGAISACSGEWQVAVYLLMDMARARIQQDADMLKITAEGQGTSTKSIGKQLSGYGQS